MEDQLYNNEERINRYLRGEMTPEEEAAFEVELQKDNTLKRQAESMARIVKEMEILGDEHDKHIVEQMKASSEKKSAPVRWISIAASFALILTVGYHIFDYNRMGNLGKEYASTFPVSTIVRGEEDADVAQKLTALFENVANGEDLDNTISQLTELWSLSQSDIYNEYSTYAPYIGWNLAIAHLRNHDKKEAKMILEELAKMYPEESAMSEKVIQLRKEL